MHHGYGHTHSIMSTCDYNSGCMLQEEMLCGKATLLLSNRSDNSIIQSVNSWSESSLASQSEWLNRFSGAHQYPEVKDPWLC